MASAALFGFLAAGVLIRLTPAAEIRISDGRVRLADVAEAPPASLGPMEVARLPIGAARTITRAHLADLIRHAFPAADISGDLDGNVTFRSDAATAASAAKAYSPEAPAVERGAKLSLVSSVGPVVVKRPVVALQSAARSDKRVFVRTEDGDVFAAPIAKAVSK